MAKSSKYSKQSKASKPRKQGSVKGINTALVGFKETTIVSRPEMTEVGERKIPTYRRSGHLHDQMLAYKKPGSVQGNLFEMLADETLRKIAADGVTQDSVLIEGIKLTDTEHRLIDCINRLQHVKSHNVYNIEDKESFYAGNEKAESLVAYGRDESGKQLAAATPMLRFKPSELYETYKGDKNYSGRDIEHIKGVFTGLAEKKFLIRYSRKIEGRNGELIKQTIEDYTPLFKILTYTEEKGRKTDGGEEYSKVKEEILIQLNPIFKDQIETKYIEFPTDIVKRTIIAVGSHNIPESTNLLRDALLRDLSNKQYVREYNYDTLPYLLKLDKYVKESRKRLIKERINQAVEAVKALGLVTQVEEAIGAEGQLKLIFRLNKDFLKP